MCAMDRRKEEVSPLRAGDDEGSSASSRNLERAGRTGTFHLPELAVLRFAAFLMIFTYHACDIPSVRSSVLLESLRRSCVSGVQIFFVLSAFLITELLRRERNRSGQINLRFFYVRRILRIWPLYFMWLGTAYFLSHRLSAGQGISWPTVLHYSILMGNWDAAFKGPLPLGFGSLWTISVEEQFYLLWPVLYSKLTPRQLLVVCLVASVVGLLEMLRWYLTQTPGGPSIYFSSWPYIVSFASGATISILLQRRRWSPCTPARLALLVGGLLSAYVAAVPLSMTGTSNFLLRQIPAYHVDCLAGVLLFLAAYQAHTLRRFTALAYLGTISYSLYLFHEPIVVLCHGLIDQSRYITHYRALIYLISASALSLLSAWLSYTCFERPILRLKKRFEVVPSQST